MAQRTETDLRELTDLVKGLASKIESLNTKIETLDRRVEQGFNDADKKIEALDKKIDLKFAEVDTKIQALGSKTELSFSEVNGKLDLVTTSLKIADVNITKLDARIWAFGGFALTVSVGSLLTVFIRFMFMNPLKF
jgi:predicted RNase H-like nuclease (RuvC/YqgF family)